MIGSTSKSQRPIAERLPLHGLDFDRQEREPDPAKLDEAAGVIRKNLIELGFEEVAN